MPHKALKLGRPVYRGYIPPDLPQNRPRNPIKPWYKVMGRPVVDIHPEKEVEEWAPEAEYPAVFDATPAGLKRKFRLDWYDQIKSLPTYAQKMQEFNRHCSHYMAHFKNHIALYDGLPVVKYMTQTHVIQGLPNSYQNSPLERQPGGAQESELQKSSEHEHVKRIKKLVLDQIALEKYETKKLVGHFIACSSNDKYRLQYVGDSLIHNLVGTLRRALAPDLNQQLLDYQIDQSPAIRSWWYHSGFQAPNTKLYYNSRKDADGKISQIIQVDGRSAMNFRSDHLMEPELDLNDELITNTSLIKELSVNLKYYLGFYKFKWPVGLAGFWPEERPKFDCPHTCFLTTDCLAIRNKNYRNQATPITQDEDGLTCQAILTAFSWLNSLSMYHGYTPFQELEYPFTCQVITTDGQNWLFNVFQLNSHSFHRDLGGPQRNNICWSSGMLKLYDEYKGDNEFVGVNDEVLNLVVKFFAKQTSPSFTSSLKLRPYLGEDTRDDEDKEKTTKSLRIQLEGRTNRFLSKEWKVPMFEHLFFRHPLTRGQIKHMKARYHIPKPKTPKIFE